MVSEIKNNFKRTIIKRRAFKIFLSIFIVGIAVGALLLPSTTSKAQADVPVCPPALPEAQKNSNQPFVVCKQHFQLGMGANQGQDAGTDEFDIAVYISGGIGGYPNQDSYGDYNWAMTVSCAPDPAGRSDSCPWITPSGSKGKASFTFKPDPTKATYIWVTLTDKTNDTKLTSSASLINKNITAASDPNSMGDAGVNVLNGILGLVNKLLASIVLALNAIIFWLFSLIIAPIIEAILKIQVHDLEFSAVILAGWVFLRNLMNVAFILIMLVIALGTLFRVKSINYKELLVKVVFMAILVNFSLVIARAILGIADTVQAQFLPANAEVIKNLAAQLMLKPAELAGTSSINLQGGPLGGTVNILFNFLLAVFSFFFFLAIAAFLVIRIAMLWILLMTSPVAYAASILPQTKAYASKWWGQFIRYAFFTPVLALMLHLCAIIAVSQANYIAMISNGEFTNSAYSGNIYSALSNVLVLACLAAALYVSEHTGVLGAHAITGFVRNATEGLTIKPAGYGLKTAYEGAQAWKYKKLDESEWIKSDNLGKRLLARAIAPKKAWEGRQARIKYQRGIEAEHIESAFEQASWYRKSKGTMDLGQDRASHKHTIVEQAKAFEGRDIEQNTALVAKMFQDENNLSHRASAIWAMAQNGRLADVLKGYRIKMNQYERDANGKIKTDEKGNKILTKDAMEWRKKFGIDWMGSEKLSSHDNRRLINGFLKVDEDYGNRVFVGETLNDWAKQNGRTDMIYGVIPDPNKQGEFIDLDEYEKKGADGLSEADKLALKGEELEAKEKEGKLTKQEQAELNLLNSLRPKVKQGDKLAKWYKPAMDKFYSDPKNKDKTFRAGNRIAFERVDYLDAVTGENRAKARYRDDYIEYVKDDKGNYIVDENGQRQLTDDSIAYLQTYAQLELPAILKLSQKSLKDVVLEAQVDTESSALIIDEDQFEQFASIYGGKKEGDYAYSLKPGMENMVAAARHLSTGHSGGDRRGATADGLLFAVKTKDGSVRYATIGGAGGVVHASPGGHPIGKSDEEPFKAGEIVTHELQGAEVGTKVHVPTTDQEMASVRGTRPPVQVKVSVEPGAEGTEVTAEQAEILQDDQDG